MQKIKKGTVDGDLFYFLKVVNNFVYLLQVYGELGSGGVKLGSLKVIGRQVVLLCLMEFRQWWKLNKKNNW